MAKQVTKFIGVDGKPTVPYMERNRRPLEMAWRKFGHGVCAVLEVFTPNAPRGSKASKAKATHTSRL